MTFRIYARVGLFLIFGLGAAMTGFSKGDSIDDPNVAFIELIKKSTKGGGRDKTFQSDVPSSNDSSIKYFLLLAFVVTTVLLIILYRQVKLKQQTNAKLEEQNGLIFRQNLKLQKMNGVLEDARQQAEAGSVSKSIFLAMTSHEIRTPMNGIMGMASLLLESPLGPDQKKYVETIQASSENLLSILNDILDYSKIEAGKIDIESTFIDLDSLLSEIIVAFSKQARDRGIVLCKNVDARVPLHFNGDLLRIKQVLINLISNAIKFTKDGGVQVTVELEDSNVIDQDNMNLTRLRFSVADDGVGISDKIQRKIFESFEQGDSSISRRYGGIGLGLSISKKLVELMGGIIGLKSKVGEGSTFYFTLNVEPLEYISSEGEELKLGEKKALPDEKLAEAYPLKILVAEDNQFNMLFVEKLFENFGYREIIRAENGLEVLEILEQDTVDLILMDIQMPEMDGLQATEEIVRKYGDARPEIIAVTAEAMDDTGSPYRSLGMNGYLRKPFKKDELFKVLVSVGEKHKTKN
ncbi:MAG: ATP-binding protein [Bacteroidia bacterium]